MTNDKQDDAALQAYKERMHTAVDRMKAKLDIWVHEQDGDDLFRIVHDGLKQISIENYTEVTLALLETGIERHIHLHGETDARDLVMSAFDRRAKALRQRLQ